MLALAGHEYTQQIAYNVVWTDIKANQHTPFSININFTQTDYIADI